jgi:hypothetical protein
MARPRLAAMGLGMTPPVGWEAAIYRRAPDPGAQTYPVLHVATVPLPPGRADYGGGLVETLGPDDIFIGLLEFGPEAAKRPLFRPLISIPFLTPGAYRPHQLQRIIRGQAGVQRFFTTGGRAFCLYSVIGAFQNRIPLTARANEALGSVQVESA